MLFLVVFRISTSFAQYYWSFPAFQCHQVPVHFLLFSWQWRAEYFLKMNSGTHSTSWFYGRHPRRCSRVTAPSSRKTRASSYRTWGPQCRLYRLDVQWYFWVTFCWSEWSESEWCFLWIRAASHVQVTWKRPSWLRLARAVKQVSMLTYCL